MAATVSIDLAKIARALRLPDQRVGKVVELLDAGNTVPFITRYRKDQTGGLDEEQIRQIQSRVGQARLLADRKQTILRSIESQGRLTPELSAAIEAAVTSKQLEDLYLPYKPKKRSLATLARERGLEPLANEILTADPLAADLDRRATDFINPDKKVNSIADALLGAGHILAERFSERVDLRQQLRDILERTGVLCSVRIETEQKPAEAHAAPAAAEMADAAAEQSAASGEAPSEEAPSDELASDDGVPAELEGALPDVDLAAEDEGLSLAEEDLVDEANADEANADEASADEVSSGEVAEGEVAEGEEAAPDETAAADPGASADPAAESSPAATENPAPAAAPAVAATKRRPAPSKQDLQQRKAKRKLQEIEQRFADYFNFREPLGKVPPHRLLAINRGERARVLRVRLEYDQAACEAAVDQLLAPADHPHGDFLRGCGRDALSRLIMSSLEREIRRDLTELAETHAIEVFARNLRHLLLQPPVAGRRVLAIDPGFKSGCKLAALDEFGNLLAQTVVHIIGKDDRRQAARAKMAELVREHNLSVIAIGNGTACRQTEEIVAALVTEDFQDQGVAYVIVNEAGASVYSTSRLAREEFPRCDATTRGTISIGRRLQDPLSELVKIEPCSIGVGLYQHDVKAKHLRSSLDAVVESCVNYVGVDVNTASPALLQYVSGLNQLTARRVYDHRVQHGPFPSRQALTEITGLGEVAFTQAAGFLRVVGGDQPLDATWIHPESYPAAAALLERLGFAPGDLADKDRLAELAQKAAALELAALTGELGVGELTLRDILNQLVRPGRDPREDLPPPIFKRGVLKLEDLSVSMELTGTVLNVVDFGAFVDIGLNDSGLVHISQMADRYVPSPHEVVAVGDIVKVWVLGVDKARRRVSLTMIDPNRPRPEPQRRPERPRPAAQPAQGAGSQQPHQHQRSGDRPPRPGGRRPDGRGGRHDRKPAGPRVIEVRAKRKDPISLTKDKQAGKRPLQTFGELKKFYELKEDQPPGEETP